MGISIEDTVDSEEGSPFGGELAAMVKLVLAVANSGAIRDTLITAAYDCTSAARLLTCSRTPTERYARWFDHAAALKRSTAKGVALRMIWFPAHGRQPRFVSPTEIPAPELGRFNGIGLASHTVVKQLAHRSTLAQAKRGSRRAVRSKSRKWSRIPPRPHLQRLIKEMTRDGSELRSETQHPHSPFAKKLRAKTSKKARFIAPCPTPKDKTWGRVGKSHFRRAEPSSRTKHTRSSS